ncbi:MAG: flagellar hook-associated protein FlgK [Lachnospiraceae bacterium]|nr:flagellar hook-associated protein FlgK [Lachnospiraceae bacterium]
MANGFGSLYVGASGLRGAQNALNVVANNLSNIDTTGYVRQQVIFEDVNYNYFGNAAVSPQYSGLGVDIGDVVHARDRFLDQSYRLENGRYSFYSSQYEASCELETLLQETGGISFSESIKDLYSAFAEFQKDPSDTVNLNLVAQKASLFIVRAQNVYQGMKDYQTNINTKITNDVKRINEIGKSIYELNHEIQRVEAGKTETAMTLRDERDALIDELSGLARIEYKELPDGIVKIKLEGTDFLNESQCYQIGLRRDAITGFVDPYWEQLSSPVAENYYDVFNTKNISALSNSDVGEVKSLLLARGDSVATYVDIDGLTPEQYNKGMGEKAALSNSIMMNAQAELDSMIHSLVTAINDLLSPITQAENDSTYNKFESDKQTAADDIKDEEGNIVVKKGEKYLVAKDSSGKDFYISDSTRVMDSDKALFGSDGKLPPRELFSRTGCDRYNEVFYTYTDTDGNTKTQSIYVYNEEDKMDNIDDMLDTSLCYTISALTVNKDVVEDSSLIPHKTANENIAYSMADSIYNLWEERGFTLNPNDTTPCSYSEFYAKMVGQIATSGSVYKTMTDSLKGTVDSVESSRQAVIGVSSDEELVSLIKYQNAYNAASRYINTVSTMIDTLISSL